MTNSKKSIGFYVHIPFCDHKCIYCDFYSIITHHNIDDFLSVVIEELKFYRKKYGDVKISTIFFGGGTPSLLEPKHIERIINSVFKYYTLDENVEITLETNPGTVDLNKLKNFRDIGINRLSIGVQSFNNDDLKFLTRIHDRAEAIDTIENSSKAGFSNVNIDLIFSLPHQLKKVWEDNLELAISLPVTHISAYSLILERGTILNKMVLDKKVKLKSEDVDASHYDFTIDYLTGNGFEQYEVSNFCKPGFECKHNLLYWNHEEYIGIGPSAHSFINKNRWWNYSSLKMYLNAIQNKNNAIRGKELLSDEQLLEEYVMLSLRSKGLDLTDLELLYGKVWLIKNNEYINLLIKDGYLNRSENFIRFTKKGFLLCDEILLNFNNE